MFVQKGQFKVGDFLVYIEINAIVPKIPEFAEIYKYSTSGRASQGFSLSMHDFHHIIPAESDQWNEIVAGSTNWDEHFDYGKPLKADLEGIDVTELLGVVEYTE